MPTSNASHKYLLGWKILLFLCFSIQREDHLPMKILECTPAKNREKKRKSSFSQTLTPWKEHNFIQKFVSVSTLFATTPLVFPRIDVWEKTAENYILMTCHYPALGSTSDWLKQIYLAAWPIIRSPTQIWVMTRHQYGIYALVRRMSLRGEISCGFYKCRLFLKDYVFH